MPVVKPAANQPQVLLMSCHMLCLSQQLVCQPVVENPHLFLNCIWNLQVEEAPELEDSFSDLVLVNKEN